MKSLSNFLTPPDFLSMKPLSISISDTAIHYISFKNIKGKNTIGSYGKRELADGVIVNGEIKKREDLIAILRNIKKETGLQFVKISLPEEETYVFQMQIPIAVKGDKDIRQNIEFHLEENVPLPPEDLVFDYEISKCSADKNTFGVSVSAVDSKIIDCYTEVFETAGFLPVSFGVESKLVARAVISEQDYDPYIIVNIKEHATTISIVNNGVTQFTSTAAIGGRAIDEAISRNANVSIEEAKKIKQEHLYQEGFDSMKVFPSLINFVSAIKDEVERFYTFWTKQKNIPLSESNIKKIILCGHNSSVAGFERYFYLSLKKDVKLANVWSNAFSLDEYVPEVKFNESLDFAAAVGGALIK